MFGLSSLYTKLILSAGVILLVGGLYLYVTGLQNKVESLKQEKLVLIEQNKALTLTIEDTNKQILLLEKISELGNAQREEDRKIKEGQLKNIDDNIKKGWDRPVGPLLKDFLNGA
jgi:hypothetical protein